MTPYAIAGGTKKGRGVKVESEVGDGLEEVEEVEEEEEEDVTKDAMVKVSLSLLDLATTTLYLKNVHVRASFTT